MSVLDSELNRSARIEYSDSVEKGQDVTHPEDEHIEEMEDTRAAIPNEDDPLVGATLAKALLHATDL
jgi:hypothetical protein